MATKTLRESLLERWKKPTTTGTTTTTAGTTPSTTGAAYDKNTDYMDLMNKSVAQGNYTQAAQYEQARNAKIAGEGLTDYSPTTQYAGWLDTTDYGTIGKEQMASGASAADVLQTYTDRYNKASGTIGLEQYANDELQQEMLNYVNSQLGATPSFNAQQFEDSRPTIDNSDMSAQIDALLNQIRNREDFSYDAESDPLYQQYKEQYNREGDRAMRDTLAEVATNAGGMNSYAIAAAQQANDYYATQLGDKIPELQQLAYNMYLQDIDNQVRDLGLLQQMDETQYNRYLNALSQWNTDRNFAYGQYRDDVSDSQWNQSFDYNAGQDRLNNEWREKEWEHTLGREEVDDGRYENADAWDRALQLLSAGITPDSTILEQAGITAEQAAQYIKNVYNKKSSSGYSGGTPTKQNPQLTKSEIIATAAGLDEADARLFLLDNGVAIGQLDNYIALAAEQRAKGDTGGNDTGDDLAIDWNSVKALGLGSLTEDDLYNLAKRGTVYVTEKNGKYYYTLNPKMYTSKVEDVFGVANTLTNY